MANVIEFSIKGTVTSAVSAMKKVSQSIAKMGKALINATKWAAASAVALIGFVKIVNDGIDKTAKFASRLGLAVDQLSKMQFVANQAGISTEQFNMATQRMTRRVAEATQGLGEAKGALNELNIDANSFQQMSLDKQFEQLGDSLNKVEDPAQRLRLAFKLFDSEGTSVLQMLNKGSAAMRETARDAQFLGLVIDKQTAANSEKLSDAMGRATGSMKGLSRSISGELTPVMTGLSNAFANFIAKNREGIAKFVSKTIEHFFVFIEVIKQVFANFKKILTSREGFSAFLDNIGTFVTASFKMFVSWAKVLGIIFIEAFKVAGQVVTGFGTWLGESIANWASGKEMEDFSERLSNNIANALAKAGSRLTTELAAPLEEFKNRVDETGSAAAELFGISMDGAREKAALAIQSLSEFGTVAQEQLATTGESVSELMAAMEERSRTWLTSLGENSKQFAESFFTLMNTVIDSISQSMSQVIVDGGNMAKMFQNIASMVLKQLIAMLIKMGIQRLILAATTKAAVTAETSAEGARAVGTATANGIASWAAAPWPVNLGAPAFGAAMGAAAASGLSAGIATGAGIGATAGAAHGGLGNVPQEATYLLQKGERVLSPNQNSDLTSFINNEGGGGGSTVIENLNISILENATNIDSLLNLSEPEMEELVAGRIITALNNLDGQGVRPVFAERG